MKQAISRIPRIQIFQHLQANVLHIERSDRLENESHSCIFIRHIELSAAERSSERPERDIQPAVSEYLPCSMEQPFRSHAIAGIPLRGAQARGKVEFHRQGPPTGVDVDRRPRHPIRCEEDQRGDQSILLYTGGRALLTAANDF